MSDLTFDDLDRKRADADFEARKSQWLRSWRAYYGDHNKPLKKKKKQPDFNLMVNYIKLAIEVKTAFLFGEPGKEIRFTTDADITAHTEQELYLKNLWGFNRKLTKLNKLALNGHITGMAYVLVQRPINGGMFPRLTILDPEIVRPVWNPEDIDELEKVIIQYDAKDPETGKILTYKKTIERNGINWRILDQSRHPDGKLFSDPTIEEWPYTWCPVHHCQNYVDPNTFWGMSDVEDEVIGLNDAINFTLSNINKILYFHAHPKPWAKGVRADQIKANTEDMTVLESPDGMLANLEMRGDLGASITFYQTLRNAFKQISHVPEVSLGGIDDPARVSSLALRVLYGPLLMQIGQKRITYGEMLSELNRHLLEMGNPEWAGTAVENHWPYVLPEDPETEARTLAIHQQLGTSQRTILAKLGYQPDDEAANREHEQQSLGDALLKQFNSGEA